MPIESGWFRGIYRMQYRIAILFNLLLMFSFAQELPELRIDTTFNPGPAIQREEIINMCADEAHFVGGYPKLNAYINSKFIYPKGLIIEEDQLKLVVEFIVRKDGSITDEFVLVSSGYPEVDEAALNVIANMPEWISAYVDKHLLDSRVVIPFELRLKN